MPRHLLLFRLNPLYISGHYLCFSPFQFRSDLVLELLSVVLATSLFRYFYSLPGAHRIPVHHTIYGSISVLMTQLIAH